MSMNQIELLEKAIQGLRADLRLAQSRLDEGNEETALLAINHGMQAFQARLQDYQDKQAVAERVGPQSAPTRGKNDPRCTPYVQWPSGETPHHARGSDDYYAWNRR